jgi:prepilin peptidase CpaA
MIAAVIMVVFPFAMIFAALSDVFTMTIGNRISAVLIATFLLVAPFIGLTWAEFGMHFAAFASGPDGHLRAVRDRHDGRRRRQAARLDEPLDGIWSGAADYLLMATVAGGAFTLFLIFFRKSTLAVFAGEVPILRRMIDEKDVPYGVALAIGGLFAFPGIARHAVGFERARGLKNA